MPTDLEQQLARLAEALDLEAPTISFDDMVGRGTVAVDVDAPERPLPARAPRLNGGSWIDTTPTHDEIADGDGLIELAPAVASRRPTWRRVAMEVAVGVAAVAVMVVALAAIERGGKEVDPADDFPGPTTTFVSPTREVDPADDFPGLTTTFVSPTYGYSFGYIDRGALAPATDLWDPGDEHLDNLQSDDRFDAVETGLGAYFVSASTAIPGGVSIDDWYDEYVSPSGCGVPRRQQGEITIDGQSGRIAECLNLIEATVVAGGRLYLFMLGHTRSDARAFFDAWVATIDLTPETAT